MFLRNRSPLRAVLTALACLAIIAPATLATFIPPAVTVCETTLLITVQSATTTTTGGGSGATTDKFIISSGRVAYTVGTGSGAVSKQYNVQFNQASATTVNYDLSGALANRAGDSAVFTEIRSFYVKNTSVTSNITVGGGSNTAPVPVVTLAPGCEIFYRCPTTGGLAITAATADILKVTSDAVNGTADISIAGI